MLTHELTHVLSVLGGIGLALTCLRVAAFDAEATLWSLVPGVDSNNIADRVAESGAAPLVEGQVGLLFRAEQGLELTLKARIIQDVWTPWFEGVAIFGEVAADPALDAVAIGTVSECLQNLVDLYPPQDGNAQPNDPTAIEAFYREHAAEFETRSSGAIARRGPVRLSAYLRDANPAYLAGYLAVRSVVSAWRLRTDLPLTGTQAFNLLLHATRHGTFEAVPDLSLRSGLFEEAAHAMMCKWVQDLCGLPGEDILPFVAPRTGSAQRFVWDGPRLKESPADTNYAAEQTKIEKRRLQQAKASLFGPEDVDRIPGGGAFLHALLELSYDVIRKHAQSDDESQLDMVSQFFTAGSLLPIGRASCTFFLNRDSASRTSYLATQIRTTENHVTDGEPSVNGFWFPISYEGGELIQAGYHRLGAPRVQVTRVIDLGGTVLPGFARPGAHVLAFQYADWFEIRGASSFAESLLSADQEHKDAVSHRIRMRLNPPPFLRAVIENISRGELAAKRTQKWIERSERWDLDGQIIPVEPWAQYVRSLADQILVPESGRMSRQTKSGRALVSRLFTGEVADLVFSGGFEALTDRAPDRRDSLIAALFATAQRSRFGPETADAFVGFAAGSMDIGYEGLHGWDVRPASVSAKEAQL